MIVVVIIIVAIVIGYFIFRSSDGVEYEDNSYKEKAFICDHGECASCGRSLNGARAYRITGDAFFDSEEYVHFCYRRSDEARKRTGDGLDYLIDAALHVLSEVKDMQDREKTESYVKAALVCLIKTVFYSK